MIATLFVFFILLAGVILGPMIAGHQGYVLIQSSQYEIETSLSALILAAIILYLVLRIIEWGLRILLRSISCILSWFHTRKQAKNRRQTQNALLKLAEGDYQQAEKLLKEVIPLNQGDALAVAIAQVRLLLQQNNVYEARHHMEQLLSKTPRHPEVLRLAGEIYLKGRHARELLAILPVMGKLHLYDEQQLGELKQQAYSELMQDALSQGLPALKSWWRQQPRQVRRSIPLQLDYIQKVIANENSAAAEKMLLHCLKKQPDSKVFTIISHSFTAPSLALEKRLQRLIKRNSSAEIYAALGRLLMNRSEWQPACDALQKSLQCQSDQHNYTMLADVLENMQRFDEANKIRHAIVEQK